MAREGDCPLLPGMATNLLARGEELWVGNLSIVDSASISSWNPGDTGSTRFGPFPEAYRQSNPLYSIYNVVSIAFTGSRMITGMAAADVLWVYDAGSTTPADCVIIPQRARRGVPPKLAEDIGLLEFEEMFASASFLMGVHVLSRDCVLLIHYDQDMDRGYLSSSAFGTVLHSALRPVCVDILLRRRDAGQARFTTRADTLFRLDQLVTDRLCQGRDLVMESWRGRMFMMRSIATWAICTFLFSSVRASFRLHDSEAVVVPSPHLGEAVGTVLRDAAPGGRVYCPI